MSTDERIKLPTAVFLLLIKDGKVLLLKRKSGWSAGNYDLIAGHIDGDEGLIDALFRETTEEVGITFDKSSAEFVHLAHFLGSREYLYVAFKVTAWQGDPRLLEADKHDDLNWFELNKLPSNLAIGSATILSSYIKGVKFSEVSD